MLGAVPAVNVTEPAGVYEAPVTEVDRVKHVPDKEPVKVTVGVIVAAVPVKLALFGGVVPALKVPWASTYLIPLVEVVSEVKLPEPPEIDSTYVILPVAVAVLAVKPIVG
jgi:hypothetical protein